MRVFLLFLLLAGLPSSSGRRPSLPADGEQVKATHFQGTQGRDIIGDVGKRIQQFFDFLCSRCREVISQIDKQINSESLLEYAKQFCDQAIAASSLRDVCHNVTKGILKEVYAFLKKLEPNPQICAHLRLCDSCGNSTRRELSLFSADSSQLINGKLNHLFPLGDVFSSSEVLSRQQPGSDDNEIKP